MNKISIGNEPLKVSPVRKPLLNSRIPFKMTNTLRKIRFHSIEIVNKYINKLICWLIGHKTYNQVVNLGLKNEYYNKVCWRCGKERIVNKYRTLYK